MRVLGVTLDRRLTFDNHVSAVARSCNYHVHAIRHILVAGGAADHVQVGRTDVQDSTDVSTTLPGDVSLYE